MKTIYTSAEESWRHWQLTRPPLEYYAESLGAKLVNLPKSKLRNPQWVIFDAMRESLGERGNSIWMDSDILVRDDAPDLFAGFEGRFMVCEPSIPSRIHPHWRRIWRSMGVPNPRPYPITAIMSWPPESPPLLLEWLEENEYRFSASMGDQELLAVALWECNIPFWFFPQEWHRMVKYVKPRTPFKHAAGRRKLLRIEEFLALNSR